VISIIEEISNIVWSNTIDDSIAVTSRGELTISFTTNSWFIGTPCPNSGVLKEKASVAGSVVGVD